jgi:polyribonucleotide nucleotidyltransferase
MLDAGVPISAPVAGVSVGLASNKLLLDITGTEDHFGQMDCKVCGTFGGITAIQCDVKEPVDLNVVIDGLKLAKQGRHAILREMDAACVDTLGGLFPRSTMKRTAPRVEVIQYDPNRKRDLIGPGGSVLRQLEDRFNVTLDLSQEGRCRELWMMTHFWWW